jgi:hypothetical protein
MRKAKSLENEEEFKLMLTSLFKDFKEFNINPYNFNNTVASIDTVWRDDLGKGNVRYELARSIHLLEDSQKVTQLCNVKLIPVELKFEFTEIDLSADKEPSTPATFTPAFSGEGLHQLLENEAYTNIIGSKHRAIAPSTQKIIDTKKAAKYKPAAWEVYKSALEAEGAYLYLPKYKDWVFINHVTITEDTQCYGIANRFHCVLINTAAAEWRDPDDLFLNEEDVLILPNSPVLSEEEFTNSDRPKILIEKFKEIYKEQQSDGFISEGDLEAEALNFSCGSEEQLGKMLTTVIHACVPMNVWEEEKVNELVLVISASTDSGDPAALNEDNMGWNDNNWDFITSRLGVVNKETVVAAIDACIEANTPSGHTWEYNDGPYDRESAYDKSPLQLHFSVNAPSAHEQILAKQTIKSMKNMFSAKLVEDILSINTKIENEHPSGKTIRES